MAKYRSVAVTYSQTTESGLIKQLTFGHDPKSLITRALYNLALCYVHILHDKGVECYWDRSPY